MVEDDWVGDVIFFDDSSGSFLSIYGSTKDEDNSTSELVVVGGLLC